MRPFLESHAGAGGNERPGSAAAGAYSPAAAGAAGNSNWVHNLWIQFEVFKAAVGTASALPATAAAVRDLERALRAELPRPRGTGISSRKTRLGPLQQRLRSRMQQRLRRAVLGKRAAKWELKRAKSSTLGGIVTLEALVSVCLAAPVVSSRALVRAFRDVKGLTSDFCNRSTGNQTPPRILITSTPVAKV